MRVIQQSYYYDVKDLGLLKLTLTKRQHERELQHLVVVFKVAAVYLKNEVIFKTLKLASNSINRKH